MNNLFRCSAFALTIAASLMPAPCLAADTLYDRIGGAPVLARVVDDFMQFNRSNPRTERSFRKINKKRFSEELNKQLCELSNGPCDYQGDDMKLVHGGLEITDAEFNGVVENLTAALERNGVGLREKNELLRLLAPMKRDVVTK